MLFKIRTLLFCFTLVIATKPLSSLASAANTTTTAATTATATASVAAPTISNTVLTCKCIQNVETKMTRCPGSTWNLDIAGYRGNCKRKHEYRNGDCDCSGCFTCQDIDLR